MNASQAINNLGHGDCVKLTWSETSLPNEESSHLHTISETPFGRFVLSWKGWKAPEDIGLVFEETPWGDVACQPWGSIEEAKDWASSQMTARLKSMISEVGGRECELPGRTNHSNSRQFPGRPTTQFLFCNHHHELTEFHELVDFGDGQFIANRAALPLLLALHLAGLRTRTHHWEGAGHGFIGILMDDVSLEVRSVNEVHSTRSRYNGKNELLISWNVPTGFPENNPNRHPLVHMIDHYAGNITTDNRQRLMELLDELNKLLLLQDQERSDNIQMKGQ